MEFITNVFGKNLEILIKILLLLAHKTSINLHIIITMIRDWEFL